MCVGSDRLSFIHVRLYVSDEIQQLDLNDTSLMDLLRGVQQCKQKCTFWMFLELIQIRDECMVRIDGQSKQYGAELQETISDVLETWEGQNIISVKWQKLTDPHKAELRQKEKVRTMKICKTCKNHQGLRQKKEGICKIYILWVLVITPDIRQIYKKNLMGNWKWYCFVWRNNLFKFEASIRQNYVTSQK